jgi:hypothetical protein
MVEWWVIGYAIVLLSGAGLFLRLVAKETRRREKYLQLRLEKEQHEAELAANRAAMANARTGDGEADQDAPADGVETVTAAPAAQAA